MTRRTRSTANLARRLDALESEREDDQPLSLAEILAEEQQADSTDMKEAWKRDLQEQEENDVAAASERE
jgi:hypothetical protein